MANVFPQIDKPKKMLTITNTTEYTAASFESGSVTLALIMRAKKLVKKITRQPCLHDMVQSARESKPRVLSKGKKKRDSVDFVCS